MGAEHPIGDYDLKELNKMVRQDEQRDPPKFDPENRKLGDSSSENRRVDYFKPYDPKDGDPEEAAIERMKKRDASNPPDPDWELTIPATALLGSDLKAINPDKNKLSGENIPESLKWTEISKEQFIVLVDLIKANSGGYNSTEGENGLSESKLPERSNNANYLEIRYVPVLTSIVSTNYRIRKLEDDKFSVEAKLIGTREASTWSTETGAIGSADKSKPENVSIVYEAVMDQKPEI